MMTARGSDRTREHIDGMFYRAYTNNNYETIINIGISLMKDPGQVDIKYYNYYI